MDSEVDETGQALLEAARALAPRIRESADVIEQEQRLPEPLVTAMAEAGLFKMLAPRELGGSQVAPLTYVRVVEEIARVDGSAGWCVMIPSGMSAAAGCMSEEAAREIFGDARSYVAGSVTAVGHGEVTEGGYRVTGRWSFTSGCRQATWLCGVTAIYDGDTRVMDADGSPERRFLFFPVADCSIIDAWNVTGLRGSGSHDFAVTDVFVPERRSLPQSSPIIPRHPDPVYAFAAGFAPISPGGSGGGSGGGIGVHSAWSSLATIGFAAVSPGIARGAIDAFVELASTKTIIGGLALLRDDAVVQMQLGQADATLLAARAMVYDAVQSVWATVKDTGACTANQKMLLRLVGTHAAAQAAQVVETVWKAAGSSSIFASNPLERRFRDVHVATQNIAVGTPNYAAAGRVLLRAGSSWASS